MKEFIINRPCLSLRCLEREAGIPAKTLSHYINGRRELTKAHKRSLLPILEFYGYINNEL